MKPRLLDLFCGAGGATKGYQRAGFYVVGVDIRPQPNYCGDEFYRVDAMKVLQGWEPPAAGLGLDDDNAYERWGDIRWALRLTRFDAIHASPPCQAFSSITVVRGRRADHPDLIAAVRLALREWNRPWVIENVAGAPLTPAVVLCGSTFGLGVRRHRLFESPVPMMQAECRHGEQGVPLGVYGHPGGGESSNRKNRGKKGSAAEWARAMDIDWMTARELGQAIPPAYTEHIGSYLMAEVNARSAA